MSNFGKGLYKDLRESRLWPVALGLVLALVAVPVVLSKPANEAAPEPPAQPVGTGGAASALGELKPIAEVKAASETTERKSVDRLPARNPFEPLKKEGDGDGAVAGTTGPVGATDATGAAGTGGTAGSGSTGTGTGGGSTGGGTSGGGTSGDSSDPSVFYYTFVADVTFGKVDETTRRKIQQLRALPSSELPVIVFMGATADGDEAVFLVGSGADVTGDGTCKPSDEDCSFLYMKPGDSASIAVGDATGALTNYELKLHKITVEKLEKPPTASSSSTKAKTMKQGAQISKVENREKRHKRAEKRRAQARAKGFFELFEKLGF